MLYQRFYGLLPYSWGPQEPLTQALEAGSIWAARRSDGTRPRERALAHGLTCATCSRFGRSLRPLQRYPRDLDSQPLSMLPLIEAFRCRLQRAPTGCTLKVEGGWQVEVASGLAVGPNYPKSVSTHRRAM